jgi:hypothetical protein
VITSLPRSTLAPTSNPIAVAASQCPTHRDFVPWRFSDDGRLSGWIGLRAGIRNPAQEETPALRSEIAERAPFALVVIGVVLR